MARRILVTGAAGFIGFHTSQALLSQGDQVIGFDNFNDYYDPTLKRARAEVLASRAGFEMVESDLTSAGELDDAVRRSDAVVHLAAQPGIRYSLENPGAYIQSNLVGFANLLESCKVHKPQHLVYASSSSVYGGNEKMPFSEEDRVDSPVSLYAATKKSNELMARVYSHLYNIPTTGLRFFTVYGPWGRPDMATFLFTKAILSGDPIKVFNHGEMKRDFTYVDDIVHGVLALLDRAPEGEVPAAIYNIGNSEPVEILRFIQILEAEIGQKAKIDLLPLQPGDAVATYADTSAIEAATGFRPTTPLEIGIPKFVSWYRSFYGV